MMLSGHPLIVSIHVTLNGSICMIVLTLHVEHIYNAIEIFQLRNSSEGQHVVPDKLN